MTFREADHLAQLLAAMEAQPGQTEAAKVQIADLKQELAASQVPSNIPKYNPVQCCGSGFILIRIRMRIQGFDDLKLKKIQLNFFLFLIKNGYFFYF